MQTATENNLLSEKSVMNHPNRQSGFNVSPCNQYLVRNDSKNDSSFQHNKSSFNRLTITKNAGTLHQHAATMCPNPGTTILSDSLYHDVSYTNYQARHTVNGLLESHPYAHQQLNQSGFNAGAPFSPMIVEKKPLTNSVMLKRDGLSTIFSRKSLQSQGNASVCSSPRTFWRNPKMTPLLDTDFVYK